MKKLCSWLSILLIIAMTDISTVYANPIEDENKGKILTEHVVGLEHMWESTKTYCYEEESLVSVLYDEHDYTKSSSKAEERYIYDENGKLVRKEVFQIESTPNSRGEYMGISSRTVAYHFAPQAEPVVSVLYLYDDKGQLIAEMNGLTSEINVLYFYDERGNMIQKHEGENIYTYVYDSNNNLTDEERCEGTQVNRWHYKYDETGRKIQTIDGKGNITNNTYDEEGNEYGSLTVKIYDSKGRIIFDGFSNEMFGYTEYTYID